METKDGGGEVEECLIHTPLTNRDFSCSKNLVPLLSRTEAVKLIFCFISSGGQKAHSEPV